MTGHHHQHPIARRIAEEQRWHWLLTVYTSGEFC